MHNTIIPHSSFLIQKGGLMKRYALHKFTFVVFRYTAAPVIRWIMRYKCDKLKGPDAPSLIISNHNTNIDPVLVASGFSRHMYFLASEHTLRKGLVSKLLGFFLDPIPINKSRTDTFAIKEMLRRIKAGANVCLFAEGDRSFNGMTGPISLSTAKLAKMSGADLITFRFEGGYFTAPRWAKRQRYGKMTGRCVGRYTSAELKTMTTQQILGIIERDIYEDAYERQKMNLTRFKGKSLAENIETVLYVCPACEKIGSIRSEGERFFCSCGLEATYGETGLLSGEGLQFSTITEWDNWQSEKLEDIVNRSENSPICSDEEQMLFSVHAAVSGEPEGKGPMSIDRETFRCAGQTFPLEQITRFAVVGQMTLLFALKGGGSYEVHSNTPRSALKYREIFRILKGAGAQETN